MVRSARITTSSEGGRSGFIVRREEVAVVRRQLKSYAKLRSLVDDWIDAAMGLSTLRLEQQRDRAGKTPRSGATT